jgi:hypothetical protein
MSLFAHHAHGILEIEVFGHDIAPDGMVEHVVAAVVAASVLFFLAYGVYACARDLRRWMRPSA